MEITPAIKEDFLRFNDTDTVSSMVGKLQQFEKRSGIIFKNNKYIGLIEKKKLLKNTTHTTTTKLGSIAHKVAVLNKNDDIIKASSLMSQSQTSLLPVEENKQIIGVVQSLDLLKLATKLPELKGLSVKNTKLLKPKTKLQKNDPVSKAMTLMFKQQTDHVIVFDGEEVHGILSYRDLLRKYLNWSPKRNTSAKFNKEMAKTKAAQVDTLSTASLPVSTFSTNDNVVALDANSPLTEAMNLMVKSNISTVVVTKDFKTVSLLTIKNILKRIGELEEKESFTTQFVGLSKVRLTTHEKESLQKVANAEAKKLQRQIKNDFNLKIHLKSYDKDGTRQKYSIHLTLEYPGKVVSVKQEDWDATTALRKALTNAKNKLKSQFKTKRSR